MIKLIIVFSVLVSNMVAVYSQSNVSNYQLTVAIGSNVIDDTFTANYNPFNVNEQWNIGKLPSYFSVSSEFSEKTAVEIMVSTNEYKKGKLVNGTLLDTKKNHFSLDVFFQYKLVGRYSNFINKEIFDPFFKIGMGETKIENSSFFTINYGLGAYIWLPAFNNCNCALDGNSSSNIGIIIGTTGKSSFQQKVNGNQIQHAIGVCYRF